MKSPTTVIFDYTLYESDLHFSFSNALNISGPRLYPPLLGELWHMLSRLCFFKDFSSQASHGQRPSSRRSSPTWEWHLRLTSLGLLHLGARDTIPSDVVALTPNMQELRDRFICTPVDDEGWCGSKEAIVHLLQQNQCFTTTEYDCSEL